MRRGSYQTNGRGPVTSVLRACGPVVLVAAVTLAETVGCAMSKPIGAPAASAHAHKPNTPRNLRTADADAAGRTYLMIGGERIEAADVWRETGDELSAMSKSLVPSAYRSYVERLAAERINNRIAGTLLYKQTKLRMSPEAEKRIDAYVDEEIRKHIAAKFGGVARRYEKDLQARNLTMAQARESRRRDILIASYLEQEIKPQVAEPTRADLQAAYVAQADSLRRPERRRMSLIDIRAGERVVTTAALTPAGASPDERTDARTRIQGVIAEIKSGADFAQIARQQSDGLRAADGGAWGWVTRGSVRERFEPAVEALYRMAAGEISGPIETNGGILLVRCNEIEPGVDPDFESVQPMLKETHFRTTYNRLISERVAELRSQARIDPTAIEHFHAVVVQMALDRSGDAGP